MSNFAIKLQEKIQQNTDMLFTSTTATILEYDHASNTASIKYMNPNGEGEVLRKNVQVCVPMGGITTAAPSPGTTCTVTFQANQIYAPIITGFADKSYAATVYPLKANTDEGAFVVSQSVNSLETESVKTAPMVDDWFNKTPMNPDLCHEDMDPDIGAEMFQMIYETDKYSSSDEGLTNIKTKSTVKTCENGDIEVFVSGNIGIRVSPSEKTVNIYGDGMVSGDRWTLNVPDVVINGNVTINGKLIQGGD